MRQWVRRREFLRSMSTVAAGSLVWAKARAPETESPTAPAHAPYGAGPAHARLFVGCCAYSFKKYLASGQMTMEDFILKAVELGLHGVDLTTYWLKSTDPTYLAGLRHLAFKNGVAFSGAAIATNMCQPDPAKRAEEVEKIRRWVDATELLGAAHLRVFGGPLPKGATVEQGIPWVVETLKPACELAGKKGITLGLEDHHGITAKASTILEILRRVDSPYAGINLDITNFDEDYYSQIEACIPRATHTHIRDVFSTTREPVDLDRVFQMFRSAGYKGYMSAEYEGEEDALTGVPKLLAKIKTLCQKYSTA